MRKPDASWSFPLSLRRSTSPDSLDLTRHSLNQRAPEDTFYRPRESCLGSSGASDSTRNFRDRESGSKDYKRVSTNEKGSAGARFPKHNVSTWTALADAAAVMLLLGVLIFVIMVWRLHGTRTTEETDRKWRNAITVLATIFPILFAAVVGRLMAEAARWRLEKGSSVGSLEQLMGSRTVGATLHNPSRTHDNCRPFGGLAPLLKEQRELKPLCLVGPIMRLVPDIAVDAVWHLRSDQQFRWRCTTTLCNSGVSRDDWQLTSIQLATWRAVISL